MTSLTVKSVAFGLLILNQQAPASAQQRDDTTAPASPITGTTDTSNAVTSFDPPTGSKNPASLVPVQLDSVKQIPLFGQWALRKRLADTGITLSARDVLEPAANTAGYKGAGFSIVQHLDVGVALDLGKLGVVDDGTLRFVVTDRLGDGINSTRTGAYIQNQAFYGQGKNVRLNEISYEQLFLDRRLSVKGGFYPMGNEFGKLPYTCNFINNGNCGHPLGPIYSSGWRDDPTGQWGGRVKWTDHAGWYAEAGVYDVNAIRKTAGHGFDLGFQGDTGAFFPVEFGYVRGRMPSDYAGTYKVTFYYDTSRATRLGVENATTKGRSGAIVQAAQQIWKPHADTLRGVAVFAVWTIADRKTGLLRNSYEAGASWRGVLASRADDILSVSWNRVDVNSRLIDAQERTGADPQSNEQMWELNYGVQVTHWLLARPGIQYVIRPGAFASRPDAVVFAGHLQATF
jgi:porin